MKRLIFTTLLMVSLSVFLNAQIKYHASYTKVALAGTSTLHNSTKPVLMFLKQHAACH